MRAPGPVPTLEELSPQLPFLDRFPRLDTMRTVLSLLLAWVVFCPSLHAAKAKTNLRVIVQNEEGDAVPRATVVVRTLKGKKLRKVGRSYELRTSLEGTAPLPPLRQGAVLIQVIAKGYQTYGETVHLTEVDQTHTVTLKPPQDQHSVHTTEEQEE